MTVLLLNGMFLCKFKTKDNDKQLNTQDKKLVQRLEQLTQNRKYKDILELL